MVEELVLLLQELLARHRALALENSQLLEQLRLLVCERATLQQQVCPPSCLLSSPSKVKGDGGLLPALIVQTLSYMLANQERFFNDALKVAFLISLLSGNSESWVASYLQKQSTLLSDYAVFVEEMKQQFGWYDDNKDEEEEEDGDDDDDDDGYYFDDDDDDGDYVYDNVDEGDELEEDNC